MEWINFSEEKPIENGKYVVEATSLMGNNKRLETKWNGKAFSCSLKVKRWLKES